MTALADQIRARLVELGDAGVDGTEAEQAIGAATEISALSCAIDAVLDYAAGAGDVVGRGLLETMAEALGIEVLR